MGNFTALGCEALCSVSRFCGFNFIFVDEVQQVFARRNAQLGIDVTDVGAYGVFGEEKLPSNITVIVAAAKVVQSLGFARRNAELLSQFVAAFVDELIRSDFINNTSVLFGLVGLHKGKRIQNQKDSQEDKAEIFAADPYCVNEEKSGAVC